MGYSKPVIASASSKSTLTAFAYMNNVNAADNSAKMSLTTDNQLENLPGFAGTDVDEMAFANILQSSVYVQQFLWNSSATNTTSLTSFVIRPNALFTTLPASDGTTSRNLYFHTPMGYVSNIFQYWRGSINYTFKVVKTEYHSGRLMVAFFPGAGDETFTTAEYVYREVFDLREASEFTFTVPYTATTPYLRHDQSMGKLRIYVLNQLTAPSTVSNAVSIIVEVSAGPDMEFAFPTPARQLPVIYSQSGIVLRSRLKAQGMGNQVQDSSNARVHNKPDLIGGSSVETLDPARYCIGERILSVRQLIKRAGLIFQNAGTTVTTNSVDIYPYANYTPSFKLGFPISKSANFGIDMVAYFAPLYRYYRGGMRYKLIDNVATGQVLTATLRTDGGIAVKLPVYSSGGVFNAACANQVITTTQMQGGIELEVPYYGYSHSRTVQSSATQPVAGPNLGETVLVVSQSAVYSTNMKLFRFAADDFSFGFFIGCPPLSGDVTAP